MKTFTTLTLNATAPVLFLIPLYFLVWTAACEPVESAESRLTTLIFELKADYTGNYLGPISHYADTDTYRSLYTQELFERNSSDRDDI